MDDSCPAPRTSREYGTVHVGGVLCCAVRVLRGTIFFADVCTCVGAAGRDNASTVWYLSTISFSVILLSLRTKLESAIVAFLAPCHCYHFDRATATATGPFNMSTFMLTVTLRTLFTDHCMGYLLHRRCLSPALPIDCLAFCKQGCKLAELTSTVEQEAHLSSEYKARPLMYAG